MEILEVRIWRAAALASALAFCLAAACAANAGATAELGDWEIRLELDKGGWADGGGEQPLGVGVPLREGQLRNVGGLAVHTAGGRPLPAQFEARRRYGDGSVQWLWVDFQAPAAPHYVLRPSGENPLPSPGVRVEENDGSILVDNGALRLEWAKTGATPRAVALLDGDEPEIAVSGADGAGAYIVTPDGRRATMSGPAAELQWTVERANRLAAVLLVEGWYATESGERLARGRIRYRVHWNRTQVEMDHTFIATRSNDEVTYQEIGIRLPLDPGPRAAVRFGREGEEALVSALPEAGEAWIHQAAYPMYHRRESLYLAGGELRAEGREASGWCALHNGRTGVFLAVRDFAPQFPKELSASREGVTAKLWSGRGGRVLDYRPKTLIEEWWGDWFHRNKETYWRNGLPEELRDREAWETYNPSNVGVARSHELMFAFGRPRRLAGESAQWHRAFQTRPLVCPDPRWTCRVGAATFWPMAAKGEGGPEFDDIERLISAWFDQYMIPDSLFPFTGWYDWGRTPVDRYAADRAEGGDLVWAHMFRIGIVNRYMFNKYLMIAWARSGDRKYYDLAARLNRFLRDYYFVQWGHRKGRFSQRAAWLLPVWGGGALRPGVDSENVTGLALQYLFQGCEDSKGTILRLQDALLPAFRPVPQFTATAPDMVTAYMTGIWRVTGDETLEGHIHELFRAWTDPDGPAGISEEFFSHWDGTHYANPLYKLLRKAGAMAEYALVFGGDEAKAIATKAAREVAERYKDGTEPISYCNLSGAIGAYAYLWEQNPGFLETPAYQVETSRKLFRAFEALPPEERGAERWLSRANFSRSSYEANFTFPELQLYRKDREGEIMRHRSGQEMHIRLSFTVSSAAAPLMSLPVSIGALSGTPPFTPESKAGVGYQ